jgi:hypothetical protein
MPKDANALEEQIVGKVRASGREFYTSCFGAFRQRWLHEQRTDHTAVSWCAIAQLTPFGLIRLPTPKAFRVSDSPGLHCSGREPRYQKCGSASVHLLNKRWILSAQPLRIFRRRLAWQRDASFCAGLQSALKQWGGRTQVNMGEVCRYALAFGRLAHRLQLAHALRGLNANIAGS